MKREIQRIFKAEIPESKRKGLVKIISALKNGAGWPGVITRQQSMDFLSKLRRFDAYPKTIQDYQVRTVGGAIVSILGIMFIISLFLGELSLYLTTNIVHELSVDTSRGEKLHININITFPSMPCSVISLDTMDISGEQRHDVHHEIFKQRLDMRGRAIDVAQRETDITSNKTHIQHVLSQTPEDAKKKGESGEGGESAIGSMASKALAQEEKEKVECGSCYGAEEFAGDCCNTCDEVRAAYSKKGWAMVDTHTVEQCKNEGQDVEEQQKAKEGCVIHGSLGVNKVAGNFHFAPGKSLTSVAISAAGLIQFQRTDHNVSHVINHLSFGRKYPGRKNPLDAVAASTQEKAAMYQYFLKVVPTSYHYLNASKQSTYQFSTTENFRKLDAFQRGLPGVFFFYDLSPIMVTFKEERTSFLHFLTGVCAIVGGIFTVAGLVDSTVYHGQKIAAKMSLGKQH